MDASLQTKFSMSFPSMNNVVFSLLWLHNGSDVSNHKPHDCLLNRLFRRRSKKNQSSASLAFVRGIHRSPVNSPHEGPVMWKMLSFDDVIMDANFSGTSSLRSNCHCTFFGCDDGSGGEEAKMKFCYLMMFTAAIWCRIYPFWQIIAKAFFSESDKRFILISSLWWLLKSRVEPCVIEWDKISVIFGSVCALYSLLIIILTQRFCSFITIK